jgi:1-acyl-sn-glycerol-3-phosphate acyltransferase
MLLSGQEYVDEYATSMKDRIVRAAKVRAREIQEAARPGSAAKELEEALDLAEGVDEGREAPVDDVQIGDDDADWNSAESGNLRAPGEAGERAAS